MSTQKRHTWWCHPLFFQQINVLMNILQIVILLHVSSVQLQSFTALGLRTKLKLILLNVLWSNLQCILTICLYPLFRHFVVDMTDFITDLTALLSKYKKVLLFVISIYIIFHYCCISVMFLWDLMYKGIHQISYKYKLFTWSKYSDFDKVIPPLLYDLIWKV